MISLDCFNSCLRICLILILVKMSYVYEEHSKGDWSRRQLRASCEVELSTYTSWDRHVDFFRDMREGWPKCLPRYTLSTSTSTYERAMRYVDKKAHPIVRTGVHVAFAGLVFCFFVVVFVLLWFAFDRIVEQVYNRLLATTPAAQPSVT